MAQSTEKMLLFLLTTLFNWQIGKEEKGKIKSTYNVAVVTYAIMLN